MNSSRYSSVFNTLNNKFNKDVWSFFLGSASLILIIIPLFQQGTFIDGLLYKTVAFNYAENLASFWNMKFTDSSMTFFCEQPPFYFFLLGLFYKLFGTYFLIDRIFTLLLFVSLIVLIYAIIKQIFQEVKANFLLTLFFLLATPVFCWSYVNQVIEPLLSLEIAAGIYFFVRFLKSGKNLFLILFALILYILFLTKGFQSCFIIVLPLSYLILAWGSRNALKFVLFSGFFLALFIVITLKYYEPAIQWFKCYYDSRLVLTMQNIGKTTDDHFEIIIRFFTELILCIGFVLLLLSYLKFKKNYPLKFAFQNFISNKLAVSLLMASLAGSLPFAISLVQRGFYLIPAFICFVLAIILGFKRYWLFFYVLLSKVSKSRIMQISTGLIVVGTCFYFFFSLNSFKRDESLIKDIELILPYLSKKEKVLIEPGLWNYFALHSYLYMSKQVSISAEYDNCRFLIIPKNSVEEQKTKFAHKIILPTQELDLYYLN